MCSQPQDHPLSLCFSTCQETESPRKREREKVKMLLPRPVLCTPASLLGVGWGLGIGIRLILTSDLSQCLLVPWEQHSIFWIPYLDLTRVSPIPWVSWALLKNTDTILQLLDNHWGGKSSQLLEPLGGKLDNRIVTWFQKSDHLLIKRGETHFTIERPSSLPLNHGSDPASQRGEMTWHCLTPCDAIRCTCIFYVIFLPKILNLILIMRKI